jgi:hypothetical protein
MNNLSELKEKIKVCVNKIDPWDLISMGAPDDEYDSYTNQIVSMVVNNKPNQVCLEKYLYELFKTKEFKLGEDGIKELTEKIIAVINK